MYIILAFLSAIKLNDVVTLMTVSVYFCHLTLLAGLNSDNENFLQIMKSEHLSDSGMKNRMLANCLVQKGFKQSFFQ